MNELLPFSIDVRCADEVWMIAFGFQTEEASDLTRTKWGLFCASLAFSALPNALCSIVVPKPYPRNVWFENASVPRHETKRVVELVAEDKDFVLQYLRECWWGELVLVRLTPESRREPLTKKTSKDWSVNTTLRGFDRRKDRACIGRLDITVQPVFTVSIFVDVGSLAGTQAGHIISRWYDAMVTSGLLGYCFPEKGM